MRSSFSPAAVSSRPRAAAVHSPRAAARRPRSAGSARCTLAALALTAALAGCGTIRPAEMRLPAPLAGSSPETVGGLGAGRSGEFTLGTERGRFQRGRDQLALLDAVSFDKASTRVSLRRADGGQVDGACRGRQVSVSASIVSGQPQPFSLECRWSGAFRASMTLAATSATSAMGGARAERLGLFTSDEATLELRSVHEVDGSPLPLATPIGYVISHQGRPVGAIELNGTTPRLWRPAGGPLREPVTQAALVLAVLWDPASR